MTRGVDEISSGLINFLSPLVLLRSLTINRQEVSAPHLMKKQLKNHEFRSLDNFHNEML